LLTCETKQLKSINVGKKMFQSNRWRTLWPDRGERLVHREGRRRFDQTGQGSISPIFYERLLREKIPKAQKRLTTWLSVIFAPFGSLSVKVAFRMMMKLSLEGYFTNVLQAAFTREDPKSAKRDWWLDSLFYAFEICSQKSCG